METLNGFPEPLSEVTRVVRLVARRDRLTDEEADELRSLTYLKLLQDSRVFERFQHRSSFATYLAVVVRRLMIDERIRRYGKRRRLKDGHARLRQFVPESAAGDLIDARAHADVELRRRDQRLQAATTRGALYAAVAALPAADRALLAWRFRDGRTIKEIAATLRQPVKPLYRRFERVLRDLRAAVERHGAAAAAREIVREPWDDVDTGMAVFAAPPFVTQIARSAASPRI